MAIWSPDLTGKQGSRYLRLVDTLNEDIAAGRLAQGARLPPYRELAYQIGFSANTVSRAYSEAIRRGLLRGEVGRGTFVRAPDGEIASASPASLLRHAEGPIDLSRNLPLPGFAEPYIRDALSELALETSLNSLLDFQTDRDVSRYTEMGLRWLDYCGISSSVDRICTTMGAQHGLFCILSALLSPGDLLLTEALTYKSVCTMAERLGLHLKPVEMDSEGVLPASFEELCRSARPKAFYLTATLQAPTTVTLSEVRRLAIAEIAKSHHILLIEDDVFAPLKADRPAALAEIAPEWTIYVTSLSKAIAPGLRVGFVSAPPSLVQAVHHAINLTVWMTPPVTLEVARRLVLSDTVDLIVRQQRTAAMHRQTLARDILKNVKLQSDAVGLHLWILLPEGRRADEVRAQCARRGVLVSEGRNFSVEERTAPEALRICISHEPNEARLRHALQVVASVLREEGKSSGLDI